MSLFKSSQKRDEHRAQLYSALIHHEAKIGGTLFGEIPKDHRREFFALDDRTWVWHEEWKDERGQWQALTTRYDVRPDGVLKSQGGANYQRLSRQELINLYRASKLYGKYIGDEQQRMLQVV
jgi:hypothetical protein